jgi:hypothetical protein
MLPAGEDVQKVARQWQDGIFGRFFLASKIAHNYLHSSYLHPTLLEPVTL